MVLRDGVGSAAWREGWRATVRVRRPGEELIRRLMDRVSDQPGKYRPGDLVWLSGFQRARTYDVLKRLLASGDLVLDDSGRVWPREQPPRRPASGSRKP